MVRKVADLFEEYPRGAGDKTMLCPSCHDGVSHDGVTVESVSHGGVTVVSVTSLTAKYLPAIQTDVFVQ